MKSHIQKNNIFTLGLRLYSGGGWRGFDPSMGLAVTDGYITVAASAILDLNAPVTGTFLGDADSNLTSDIKISAL